MQAATLTSVFEEIGVRPVINARGHMTVLGGSTPSPRVRAAMDQADRYFVDMQDLLAKSGEIVARLLGAEAAYITPGAAAALALGTAACVTGNDIDKMAQLPDTSGLKNRVVLQAKHQYQYQRACTIVGTKLVLVGDESGTTADQLRVALDEATACVLYPAHLENEPGVLSLPAVIEIAHARGVPVLVDAAGQVYPIERFKSYPRMGADLIAFGGKYFGGVNSSGILCGKKSLIDAAVPQGFIGFETMTQRRGFGRPLKLDRQEIIGLVVALQEWMAMDHEARLATFERRLGTIRRQIEGLPGVSIELIRQQGSSPRLLDVRIDPAGARRNAAAVFAGLRDGNPSIAVRPMNDAIQINVATVWEGDEEIVGQRLRQLLV
ncbi:MAG: aminotransferase class V-fold PLP-dependent enzyme [Chloroflexota bacterium]|nr:MAG: aminotransferase class V-fold PLP-dependent enzyme [Chloroflexota bacterium]